MYFDRQKRTSDSDSTLQKTYIKKGKTTFFWDVNKTK